MKSLSFFNGALSPEGYLKHRDLSSEMFSIPQNICVRDGGRERGGGGEWFL